MLLDEAIFSQSKLFERTSISAKLKEEIAYRMVRFLILGATLVILVSARLEHYCHLESCNNYITDPNFKVVPEDHTACRFSGSDVGAACGSLRVAAVTEGEKQEILRVHNNYRRYVAEGKETRGINGPQPPAKNMPDLEWSDEAAFIAQLWANQCDHEHHDKCRNNQRTKVGQNMAWSSVVGRPMNSVTEMIDGWYNEVDHFDSRFVQSFPDTSDNPDSPVTGHYTQMVWAKTTHVGCGIARYTTNDGWDNLFLVCNYEPSGNWIDEPVYEIASSTRMSRLGNDNAEYDQRNPVMPNNNFYPNIQDNQGNPIMPNNYNFYPDIQDNQRNPIMPNNNDCYPDIQDNQRNPIMPNNNDFYPDIQDNQRNPIMPSNNNFYPEIQDNQRNPIMPNNNDFYPDIQDNQRNPIMPSNNNFYPEIQDNQRNPIINYDEFYPDIPYEYNTFNQGYPDTPFNWNDFRQWRNRGFAKK